jgi:hypothetical protein
MCLGLFCSTGKVKYPEWSSEERISRKKYYCDYCKRWCKKGMKYRIVDGLKSCEECNKNYGQKD